MEEFMPYGNYWGGDVLYNLRIGIYGIEASYRFIAKDTVPVDKIRYFNTYSFTKSGYHSGNGGKIRIELQEDSDTSSHIPSGKCLAYGLVPSPLQVPQQLLVSFDKMVILEKGKIYHIVFTNYDSNPEINYVSIDMLSILMPKAADAFEQPELSSIDMTTLMRDNYNKNWRKFKSDLTVTPIFSLYYGIPSLNVDNVSVAGYAGMESWVREPRQIQGDKKVKQKFVTNKNIDVKNVCVRIAKNGNPKNLIAQLISDNKILTQGEIASKNVPNINTSADFRIGHGWVTINFEKACNLFSGKEYNLVLSAASGDAYETFPIRDGSYGFGYAPVWANAWAEYTTTGDKGWKGWDAWGNSGLKISHLQLYFNSNK